MTPQKETKREPPDIGPCRIEDLSLEADYRPALNCVCGFCAVGNSWAEAGEIMDEHLEGVEP